MPFKSRARVLLRNDTDKDLMDYSYVEWENLPEWSDRLGYFHATYHRKCFQLTKTSDETLFELEGTGHLLGRQYSIATDEPLFRGFAFVMEGNNEVDIDGQPRKLDYLGTEDSFTFSWGFQQTFTGLRAGMTLVKPDLPCGDSVTQGWMECGTNFDQRAYVDALASRGVNLLMLWSFKGTNAARQRGDPRLGYDAPEVWPWVGSPEDRSFDLRRFNPVYFQRLKHLVGHAESRGVLVLVTVHDGWTKTCFDGHPFNQALGNGPLADRRQYVELSDHGREMPPEFDPRWNRAQRNQYFQERFCAALISELEPFSNVLFEMFNEGEWYDAVQRRRHEQHFLAFFRARCTNVLVSNSDHIRGDDPHADAKVDIVSLHKPERYELWVGPSFRHRREV